MDKVKRFIYANIHLFLPGILIGILTPPLRSSFQPFFEKNAAEMFSNCDYSMGGGSLNLCSNNIYFSALVCAVLIATVSATFLTWGAAKLLQIDWYSPLYGLAFFYGVPVILFIFSAMFTNGIYGEGRGWINDVILVLGILFSIISAGLLSYSSYRKYSIKIARNEQLSSGKAAETV